MKKTPVHYAIAVAMGVGVACASHAASFDLGRVLEGVTGIAGAMKPIDEKQEIAIGRDLAGTILGAAPLVNDSALQAYVNKVGRWIASQGERPDLPWRFGVIETPGVNAFAAPGGNILITRGLYEMLDNESQLAGVLGHEIAHVIKRHHITVIQNQGALQGGVSVAQGAIGGGRSVVGRYASDAAVTAFKNILTKGLDKEAEYEADNLGVVLAARAGYSPYGLVEVMQKLQQRAAEPSFASSLALLTATHPHPNDRLERLGTAMTPRMATLPTGAEPQIQAVSASAPASKGAMRAPSGARAMQQEDQAAPPAAASSAAPAPAPSGGGLPVDPTQLLRGIFGR